MFNISIGNNFQDEILNITQGGLQKKTDNNIVFFKMPPLKIKELFISSSLWADIPEIKNVLMKGLNAIHITVVFSRKQGKNLVLIKTKISSK